MDFSLTGETVTADFLPVVASLPGRLVGPSIDWVTLAQDHAGGSVPALGSVWTRATDVATGEVAWDSLRPLAVEGSWSSRCEVRSFRDRVRISFNPSRWGRPHSVDGLCSGSDALALCQAVLAGASGALPSFSESEASAVKLASGFSPSVVEGATLSRIDICWTVSAGDASAAADVLRALSARCVDGSAARFFADRSGVPETVYWPRGAVRPYVKVYAKGPQLLANGGPQARELGELASREGWLRLEVSFSRRWLMRRGLQRLSSWTPAILASVLEEFSPFREVFMPVRLADLQAQLVARGVSPRRALLAQAAALVWSQGGDPFGAVSRASRFRLLADLRLIGWDISKPSRVVPFRPRELRPIILRPVILPAEFCR